MKPMLACDWDETKVRFPLVAQPKIDGVRAINLDGMTTGRSLKPIKNRHVRQLFMDNWLVGFDGEMCAQSETHPSLCRITTSELNSHDGQPFVLWWLFDLVREDWMHRPYMERYAELKRRVEYAQENKDRWQWAQHLRVVPFKLVENMDQLMAFEQVCLEAGYEGVILRDPAGKVKHGRSTVREGGLLRIKRFVEDEAVVIRVEEGNSNWNEATINELGRTTRSTHQVNMVPNGQVGTLICRYKNEEINISPGEMDVETRKLYFTQQDMIVGKTITFKHFPKGVKDKPRFPTFKSIREDL